MIMPTISLAQARIVAAGLTALVSAIMYKAVGKIIEQYSQAFSKEEIALKTGISLILAFAALGAAILSPAITFSWVGWTLFVPAATILGTVVLTAAHFAASLMVGGIVALYSVTSSFISGLFTKPTVEAA